MTWHEFAPRPTDDGCAAWIIPGQVGCGLRRDDPIHATTTTTLTDAEREMLDSAIAMDAINPIRSAVEAILAARLAAVEALAEGWIGFDDSHHYGDAVLRALTAPTGREPKPRRYMHGEYRP